MSSPAPHFPPRGGGRVHEKLDQFLARLKARCLAYLAPSASFVVCAWGDLTQTHALIPQYGTGNEHLGVHVHLLSMCMARNLYQVWVPFHQWHNFVVIMA